MAAECAIRSRCAPRIFLRRLPSECADEYRDFRHSDSGNRDVPEMPCAWPRARGVALLRMPYLSRLEQRETRQRHVWREAIDGLGGPSFTRFADDKNRSSAPLFECAAKPFPAPEARQGMYKLQRKARRPVLRFTSQERARNPMNGHPAAF